MLSQIKPFLSQSGSPAYAAFQTSGLPAISESSQSKALEGEKTQITNGSPVQGFCSPDGNLQRQPVGKKFWAASALFPRVTWLPGWASEQVIILPVGLPHCLRNVAPVYTSFL